MKSHSSPSDKIYLAIMAILGWFALVAQFYININSGIAESSELMIRFFSYFTITTNFIVASCCTLLLIKPFHKFFSKHSTLTAISVYILVVAIIHNFFLRSLWKPEGLQQIVDEILHSVIPALFLFYWILFVQKNKLSWTVILPWLIYPLIYLIFVLVRGTFSGFYPYPFLNADELGFRKVLINSAGITLLFIAVSILFVAVGNRNRGFLHD
ncbi:MAG: Pr6Pr family membrane protein [Ferruginibacter sp.]